MDKVVEEEVSTIKKKRGRKPSANKKKGYYFGEAEENAFNEYVTLTDPFEREKHFQSILYPAFSKMVESIIRTYSLFVPEEEFDETYCDTMSFLITKLNNFEPKSGNLTITYKVKDNKVIVNGIEYEVVDEKVIIDGIEYEIKNNALSISYGVRNNKVTVNNVEYTVENEKVAIDGVEYKVTYYKLFSYCGTICKNYLMLKRNLFKKKKEKQLSYDMLFPTADKDTRIDDDSTKVLVEFHDDLIDRTISQIQIMLDNPEAYKLSTNEEQIGFALLEMLMNWEEIFKRLENKKFNKASVWFFLKEYTRLETKDIRDGMKRYKNLYFFTKEKIIKE